MASPTRRAAKLQNPQASALRQIPSVDELLNRPKIAEIIHRAGRETAVLVARQVLSGIREELAGHSPDGQASRNFDAAQIESRIVACVERELAPSLRSVINATGVVLHTNLGRAPLPKSAAERIAATATHYSNLEYDLDTGERGKRDVHTSRALAELAGAESAIVVNNNAAAVFLVLNTLAKGAEVIVSRGELIEIGDGFRIPDIMAESGARLREVGTTNRTRIVDYERAIGKETRLLLRVHPSNFKIIGFTKRPELEELTALSRKKRIPLFEDLGSGCLTGLADAGAGEPVVRASFAAGVDIATFSGDKLLGGPQAGVIAGKRKLVERIRRNPLFRALRVDKLTVAALEATLQAHRRGALDEIPALRMIRMSADEMNRRACSFVENLREKLLDGAALEICRGFSVIGGGSTPEQKLPTTLIAVRSPRHSADSLEERLRKPQTGSPVIARIEKNTLVLDLRTVFEDEESALHQALVLALL
ncbi:MAG TPA: L-seryl-tRNA(Sec) selenium transferase [Candidatus Acidoferrales bacterium]|nr:L-seryl-tRNA(Sec) selenium transferase [Candidatus Acidoferrales bacterium]